jgi:periplasmic divalent cation tolerance protein
VGIAMAYQLVFTTCPDMSSAETLAEILLRERLAACVNILPGARSLYIWQGALQRDEEHVLLIKTHEDCLAALQQAVLAQHPYELPELIAVPIGYGSQAYLDWITQQVDKQ